MEIADQEDVDSFVMRDVHNMEFSSNIIGVVQSGTINTTSEIRHTHVVGEKTVTFLSGNLMRKDRLK
jgi:hypothetical protein